MSRGWKRNINMCCFGIVMDGMILEKGGVMRPRTFRTFL